MKASDSIRKEYANLSVQYGSKSLKDLYLKWDEYKDRFFPDSHMIQPIITIGDVQNPKALGHYWPSNPGNMAGQITIRHTLVSGAYKGFNVLNSSSLIGLERYVEDVLLHEMVHQYNHEVLKEPDGSYRGHGPFFRDQCNRIGDMLNLPKVRTCKARGEDKDLPSCSQWPHCVRPEDYYQGIDAKEPRTHVWMSVPVEMADDVRSYISNLKK